MSPLTVTELTARIKQVVEQGFSQIEVTGEVSRLSRPSSGHIYFTIKDQHAAISAAIWRTSALRLMMQPKEGQAFVFSGHLSVYEPRGTYQMIVTRLSPVGDGALAAEFEVRKRLFFERGWFAPERKRSIPSLPNHIAVMTSVTAAAFADVRKVLLSRPSWLTVTLVPCLVQGAQAPASIVKAFHQLQQCRNRPDVILLVRGGGSMEDLWCFNDEKVIEAMVHCPMPIISGIGHEIDHTLADLAADLRAATPSNAAELACPSCDTLRQRIPSLQRFGQAARQLHVRSRQGFNLQKKGMEYARMRGMDQRLHRHAQQFDLLQSVYKSSLHQKRRDLWGMRQKLMAHEPRTQWQQQRQQLSSLQSRLRNFDVSREKRSWIQLHHSLNVEVESVVLHQRRAHERLFEKLKAMDPKLVLRRGYSLVYDESGHVRTHAKGLKAEQVLHIQFQDGVVQSRVNPMMPMPSNKEKS